MERLDKYPRGEPSQSSVDCCFWAGSGKASPKGCSGGGHWRKIKATPEILEMITKREAKMVIYVIKEELKEFCRKLRSMPMSKLLM